MKLFDVYPLFDINIVKGEGTKVWDDKGQEYLDLYGGHAVRKGITSQTTNTEDGLVIYDALAQKDLSVFFERNNSLLHFLNILQLAL